MPSRWRKNLPCGHPEPFAVILSAAKNLALPAQGKLREGSRSEHIQGHARFFVAAAPQNDSAREFFRGLLD